MRKKHELLKQAYDNYPKGIKYTWSKDTIPRIAESNGVFSFNHDGWILDGNGLGIPVFNGFDWAEIVTEEKKQPQKVFIMRSVDGVNLYKGDRVWLIYRERRGSKNDGRWYVNIDAVQITGNVELVFMQEGRSDESKAFSTKEAAEKWIAEQNKPKDVTVQLGMEKAVMNLEDGISFYRSHTDKSFFGITGEELEEIYTAHKSLKC